MIWGWSMYTFRLHKSEGGKVVTVKATGGGAYKFQEVISP